MKIFGFVLFASFVFASFAHASDQVNDTKITSTVHKALGRIEQFIDYQMDLLESDFVAEAAKERLRGNIESGKQLFSCFQDVNAGKRAPKILLDELLTLRFNYLGDRSVLIQTAKAVLIKKAKGRYTGKTLMYGPTNPAGFEKLQDEGLRFFSRAATDRYQFFSQLILYTWEMIDLSSLPENTELKIRCSVTLWDLLSGKSNYLGHPDAAILVFKDQPLPLSLNPDLWNCNHYLKKHETAIPFRGRTKYINLTKYELSCRNSRNLGCDKMPDLPCPEWLKEKKSATHVVKDKNKKKFSGKRKGNKRKGRKNNGKRNVHKQKIPPNKRQDLKKIENQDNSDAVSQGQEINASDVQVASEVKKDQEISPSNTQAVTALSKKDIQDQAKGSDGESVVSKDSSKGTSIIEKNLQTPKAPDLRPRGMRVFHSEETSLSVQNRYSELKGKLQSVIDKIFSHKEFQTVSYGDFKKLWRHLHGEGSVIESNASSHKKLVARNGQVFGTYAHGDNMKYTKRTIKYLRDALSQTGYAPK